MKLRKIFGVNETKIDFKSLFLVLIGFITPHLILIAFILLVGRLILNENSGIFSNGLLGNSILEIVSYLIMTASLVYLLLNRKIPVIVSIIIAAILSRLPEYIIGNQIGFTILNIATNLIILVLIWTFSVRFKNSLIAIILAFLIGILISKVTENVMYVIHVYNNFGIDAIKINIENGEAMRKLLNDLTSGLINSILFATGLFIAHRLLIQKKA